ncbi:MAG: hypothetical protein JW881_03825 [Spirochaetales bacterium]|nr:hypothetical protein [Spirochaetales bacterium]
MKRYNIAIILSSLICLAVLLCVSCNEIGSIWNVVDENPYPDISGEWVITKSCDAFSSVTTITIEQDDADLVLTMGPAPVILSGLIEENGDIAVKGKIAINAISLKITGTGKYTKDETILLTMDINSIICDIKAERG